MPLTRQHYGKSPESLLVSLASAGEEEAFAELVRRRQSWIRNLMRRFCGNAVLADDLAQEAFLQAWRKIGQLQHPGKYGAWMKRIVINTWLQHLRKNDVLFNAEEYDGSDLALTSTISTGLDLDRALQTLPPPVRLCIVLSYLEGMTHREITDHTGLPMGTVKSHVRRGTQRLQKLLSAYSEQPQSEALI